MEYRYLGNTGLRVSILGYGNADPTCSTDVIKRCIEEGINYFDTAEGYGEGASEIALG